MKKEPYDVVLVCNMQKEFLSRGPSCFSLQEVCKFSVAIATFKQTLDSPKRELIALIQFHTFMPKYSFYASDIDFVYLFNVSSLLRR